MSRDLGVEVIIIITDTTASTTTPILPLVLLGYDRNQNILLEQERLLDFRTRLVF